MEMNEDVKERRRTMIIMKNDRPNMFAYIYSKLSIESEEEVETSRVDFPTFSPIKCPLSLWNEITSKYLISINSGNEALLKRFAFNKFAKVKQE